MAAWSACLKDVQVLVHRMPYDSDVPYIALVAARHQELLDSKHVLPRAAWKKLILDVKVGHSMLLWVTTPHL